MQHLADKNWPAEDRAIVYTEWRNLVRASLVAPPPNAEDSFIDGISIRAKGALLALSDVEEFRKTGLPYATIFGSGETMPGKTKVLTQLQAPDSVSAEMATNGWCNWIDYLVSGQGKKPNFHDDIRQMQLDDEDLAHMMQADRIGLKELPNLDRTVSLAKAQEALVASFAKTGLHRLEVPALDAEDPARLLALANCLDALATNFEALGGSGFTLGTPNSTLFIGADRAGSSGYCTGPRFMATAPKTGFPLIEVLAHEGLHMHDYAWGGGNLESEQAKKNGAGRLAAWAKLMTRLHEAPAQDAKQAAKQWKQADASLADRWASMGLPKEDLSAAHTQWKDKKLTTKGFKASLTKWFQSAGKGDTSEFRAEVVLAECRLMQRASTEKPVWQQFTYGFGDLLETKNVGVYGKDYFAAHSEVVARAFQMLFSKNKQEAASNPFAARWLVFPGADQTASIRAAWEEFLATPEVANSMIDNATPASMASIVRQGSLASNVAARRSSRKVEVQDDKLAPKSNKIAR